MKKFYFLMLAMLVGIAVNAQDYYLIGGFNNWTLKDAKTKFVNEGDGVYTLSYQGTLTSGFKINDGTWSNAQANWGGSQTLVPGQEYTLVSNSNSNIPLLENITNPQLTFKPAENTLLIEGKSVAAEYIYGIHGDIFGVTSWSTENFTESNGKWILADKTVVKGNFGIKKMDKESGSQVDWLASAGAADVTINQAMPVKIEGTNWSIAAGTYTFTFDPEAMTLTVSGQGGGDEPTPGPDPVVDYTKWYINVIGDFNDWKDNGIQADAEGLSKHTDLAIGTSGFKVKIWNGTADVYYSTGGELAQGEWIKIDGNADANMTIAGATEGQVFNVEFNCATSSIKVTAAGGDEPTPGPDPVDNFTYGIHGDIFGVTSWSTENMTFTDGKWVLADKEIIAGSFGIKQMDESGEQSLWYASAAGATIVLDQPLAATVNGTNWNIKAGTYTFTFDPEALTLTVTGVESVDPNPVYPESLYVIGDELNGAAWLVNFVELNKTAEGVFETTEGITIGGSMGGEFGYIQFCTEKGEDWNTLGTRYAADAKDVIIAVDTPVTIAKTQNAFAIAPGVYNLTVDFTASTLTVQKRDSGVTGVEADSNAPAVYYNLHGVEVANPANGLYIEVRGNATRKVLVK